MHLFVIWRFHCDGDTSRAKTAEDLLFSSGDSQTVVSATKIKENRSGTTILALSVVTFRYHDLYISTEKRRS
jgi:hypothetical protein